MLNDRRIEDCVLDARAITPCGSAWGWGAAEEGEKGKHRWPTAG